MNTWLLVVVATVCYTGFQFFSAKAGGKIDGSLVPVIVNAIGVVVTLTFLLLKVFNKSHTLHTQRSGLVYAVLASLSVAGFIMVFQKLFQHGGNLGYVSPIVFGGSIALATLLGALFLKESLSLLHIAGIVMVVAGITLIAVAKA